jgi:hypothetical protein
MDLQIEHMNYERVFVPAGKSAAEIERKLKADGWHWAGCRGDIKDEKGRVTHAIAGTWFKRDCNPTTINEDAHDPYDHIFAAPSHA